jgi:hypothetical protein
MTHKYNDPFDLDRALRRTDFSDESQVRTSLRQRLLGRQPDPANVDHVSYIYDRIRRGVTRVDNRSIPYDRQKERRTMKQAYMLNLVTLSFLGISFLICVGAVLLGSTLFDRPGTFMTPSSTTLLVTPTFINESQTTSHTACKFRGTLDILPLYNVPYTDPNQIKQMLSVTIAYPVILQNGMHYYIDLGGDGGWVDSASGFLEGDCSSVTVDTRTLEDFSSICFFSSTVEVPLYADQDLLVLKGTAKSGVVTTRSAQSYYISLDHAFGGWVALDEGALKGSCDNIPMAVTPHIGSTYTPLPDGFTPEPTHFDPTETNQPVLSEPDHGSQPKIIAFTVDPSDNLAVGQIVTVSWQLENAVTAYFTYQYAVDDGGPYGEFEVGERFDIDTLSGSKQITLTDPPNSGPIYIQFEIEVNDDDENVQIVNVPVAVCPTLWFFDRQPKWCPAFQPRPQNVFIQHFEHGIIISDVGGAEPVYAETTVLYEDGNSWETLHFYRRSIQAIPDLNPPQGLFSPDPRIDELWVGGNVDLYPDGSLDDFPPLRDRLGWATSLTVDYQAYLQFERVPQFIESTSFLSGPDGEIYSFEYFDQIWSLWEY